MGCNCLRFSDLAGYLAGAFARCNDELQSVRRRSGKAGIELTIKTLESTRSQLVNYSATCLMEVRNEAVSALHEHVVLIGWLIALQRFDWSTPLH